MADLFYTRRNSALQQQSLQIESLSTQIDKLTGSISSLEDTLLQFEYFTDILNRMDCISPNDSDDVYRELFPNYWKKQV